MLCLSPSVSQGVGRPLWLGLLLCLQAIVQSAPPPPYAPIPVSSFWYKRSPVNSTCDDLSSAAGARPLYILPFRDESDTPVMLIAGYTYCSQSSEYSSDEPALQCARPPVPALSLSADGGQSWDCVVSPDNLPSTALRIGAATFSATLQIGWDSTPLWLACIIGGQVINRPDELRSDILCASSKDLVFRTAGSVPMGITRATALVVGQDEFRVFGGIREDNSTYVISCTVTEGQPGPSINCLPLDGFLNPPWGMVVHPLVQMEADPQGNGKLKRVRIVLLGGAIPAWSDQAGSEGTAVAAAARPNLDVFVCESCEKNKAEFVRTSYGLSSMLTNGSWDASSAALIRWGGPDLGGSPFSGRCYDSFDPNFGCLILLLKGSLWLSRSRDEEMKWFQLYQLPPLQGLPRDSPLPEFSPSLLRYAVTVTDHVLQSTPVLLGVEPGSGSVAVISPFACTQECPDGFIHHGCTFSPADARCSPCSACSSGETWEKEACEIKVGPVGVYGHDTTCRRCSQCDQQTGQVIMYPCNATHDTVCANPRVVPYIPVVGGEMPPLPVAGFLLATFFGCIAVFSGLAGPHEPCAPVTSSVRRHTCDFAMSVMSICCCIWLTVECALARKAMPSLGAADVRFFHATQAVCMMSLICSVAGAVALLVVWERASVTQSLGITFRQARLHYKAHRSLFASTQFLLLCALSLLHARALWHAIAIVCRTLPAEPTHKVDTSGEPSAASSALFSARRGSMGVWFRRVARYGSLVPELVMMAIWPTVIQWCAAGREDPPVLLSWKAHLRQMSVFAAVLCSVALLLRVGDELVHVASGAGGGTGSSGLKRVATERINAASRDDDWEVAHTGTGRVTVNALRAVSHRESAGASVSLAATAGAGTATAVDVAVLSADRAERVASTLHQSSATAPVLVNAFDPVSVTPLHDISARVIVRASVAEGRVVLALEPLRSHASSMTSGDGPSRHPSMSDHSDFDRCSTDAIVSGGAPSAPASTLVSVQPAARTEAGPDDGRQGLPWTSGTDPRPLVHAVLGSLCRATGEAADVDDDPSDVPVANPVVLPEGVAAASAPAQAQDLPPSAQQQLQLMFLERALQQLLSGEAADVYEDGSSNH